jgi:hypothetical protein
MVWSWKMSIEIMIRSEYSLCLIIVHAVYAKCVCICSKKAVKKNQDICPPKRGGGGGNKKNICLNNQLTSEYPYPYCFHQHLTNDIDFCTLIDRSIGA